MSCITEPNRKLQEFNLLECTDPLAAMEAVWAAPYPAPIYYKDTRERRTARLKSWYIEQNGNHDSHGMAKCLFNLGADLFYSDMFRRLSVRAVSPYFPNARKFDLLIDCWGKIPDGANVKCVTAMGKFLQGTKNGHYLISPKEIVTRVATTENEYSTSDIVHIRECPSHNELQSAVASHIIPPLANLAMSYVGPDSLYAEDILLLHQQLESQY